ncbi:MAG: DnaD domain protein [Clostridia bacterium]|nr:DnaD domain protein [Clostridia bacterium]
MKITPIYKNRILSLPAEAVSEKLSTATGDELRVLLAVYSEPEFELSELAGRLDMTENAFRRALETWVACGALSSDAAAPAKTAEKPAKPTKPASRVSVHTTLPHYTAEELADAAVRTTAFRGLLDSCQQIFGKIFNTAETEIVAGLADHLRLDTEYILLLFTHAAEMDKKTVRYVEKMALAFYDRGITTYAALEEEIARVRELASLEVFVRSLFGIGKRALVKKETAMLEKWTGTYGFSRELIRHAYETTIAKAKEPSLSYANAVLESWYAKGFKTPEEVDAAEAERNAGTVQKQSFSTDDFYEAALKRSYQAAEAE